MYSKLLKKWRAKEAEEATLKKADWILPAGHGLDPDYEVLLRVRQRINAAKNLKDYSWQQLLDAFWWGDTVWGVGLFAFCDRDKSGTLDWKEFKHLARETLGVPQEAVCDADLRQLFRRLDQAPESDLGGELVDLSELLHYLARGEMEPAVLQARAKQRVERVRRNIMMAFLKLDLTNLDPRRLFQRIDLNSSNRDFYHFLDRDGDGIDIYEFVDYVKRVKKSRESLGAQNLQVPTWTICTRRKQQTFKDQLIQDLQNGTSSSGRSMPNLHDMSSSFVNVGRQKRPTNRFAASGMLFLA
ncbi:23 kDa calcium-binding protein (Fragment) [Durusdinium trenchii]|uniref:23 kDa calcium-binding protein n=1 Tax=Durusdinium trenchii TaxID=1381693 RepID=A0ABP0IYK1_9DINO